MPKLKLRLLSLGLYLYQMEMTGYSVVYRLLCLD
jgi:hypothetical protein